MRPQRVDPVPFPAGGEGGRFMTPIADRYRALVSERGFESDPAQADLVRKLDALAAKLEGYKAEGKPNGFSRLFGMKPAEPPRGLLSTGP